MRQIRRVLLRTNIQAELAEQWGFNDGAHSVLKYVNDVFCSMPWGIS